MPQNSSLRGLYVLTDARLGGGHEAIAQAALAGGARILQLRDKTTPLPQLLPVAHKLRQLTRQAGALFLLNDRLDIALCVGADGVHLGPDDLPVAEARRLAARVAPGFLIGASCGSVVEACHAEQAGADYIGAGAVFGTQTKSDAGDAIGLATLREIANAVPLPVAAIGGVTRDNIASCFASGAAMACVISAIALASDEDAMARAARELAELAESGFRD